MKKVKLERLLELKNMIISAKDLGEPWNYFFDHFGENPAFMRLGEPSEHPILEAVIEKIARELYKDEKVISFTKPMLVKLEKYSFFHGSFFVQGRMGVAIFFEDIDMGLLSIMSGGLGSSTTMMRFSAYKVDKDQAVHLNPRTSKEVN